MPLHDTQIRLVEQARLVIGHFQPFYNHPLRDDSGWHLETKSVITNNWKALLQIIQIYEQFF